MRSIKTEGAVGALTLHAFGPSLREAFEVVEQPCEIGEALQKPRQ
ncbi:MAG: hypothetical protein Q8R82_14155 [Hyphomonadaceae bacterium]|nr:hypothetical protein [Hyphomonadaceae bacterium]